jgi:amino acid adenylation domain-containing protein
VHRPFDLYQGPLFRATLLRLNPEEHVLVVVLHHSISDGWSMQVFFRELATIYSAFIAGEPSPLEALPIQYGDFAAWQRERFQGDTLKRELAYWRECLQGRPAVLDLPTDRERPAVQSYRGGQVSFTLPPPLVERLAALARRERASLFMVLLAGFKSLLWRYSGQTDLLVGVPIAGRDRTEVEPLIGCFANALVLRTDLAGDPSLRELVARVRATALGAYAHHELPFEKLVEELQPERSARYHPIFQVMFNFRDFSTAPQDIPGVSLEDLRVERGTALFDLSLALVRGKDGIVCGLGYSADLFDAATVERLGLHYRALLEGAVQEPDRPLSQISLWTDAERRRVLQEWNGTARDYERIACVHQLFERQVRRGPSGLALLFDKQRVTYGELNSRANHLARHLRNLGVGPEARVGLCLDRSVEMAVGLLAVLKAGGAYVPLDPRHPRERLGYMLHDAMVSVVLVQSPYREMLAACGLPLVDVDLDRWPWAADESGDDLVSGVEPDNLAYVMYTSGSTGRPKGVMVSHRSVVNHLLWRDEYFPLTSADRGLQKASLGFDDSVWEIFEPLLAGAQLVLAPPDTQADSAELVRLIARHSVTTACFVPSLLQVVLDEPELESCASLRRVTTGGESLSLALQDRFFSRLKSSLHNGYGPTEATISATFWSCKPDGERRRVPIGRPIANTTVYVVDQSLQPVPIGVPGELCIGGVGLARGYFGRPGLTAERFVPDPFAATGGARLYRTGDRARYLADGTLEFLGRLDNQVKLRGNRIELGELEAVLREHPAVQESVALVREDRPGEQRLVGYVVPRPQAFSTDGAARDRAEDEHLAQWRARYEEIYGQSTSASAGSFDTAGWISSYTDRAIPPAEMQEWVTHTVDRILRLQPRRVLEIGCGTGLLLLRVAPHCEMYLGTDFSPTVLQSLRQQVERAGLGPKVTLLQREGSDFTGLADGSVDLMVLNSVSQYLPGIDHLLRVIEGGLRVLAPGGAIFIGDVRNFDLLEAFHTSVELFRAPDALTTHELRQRVSQRVSAESELLISPAFFDTLLSSFPSIEQVEVLLKRGRASNELTRFRYDVTLRLKSSTRRDAAVPLTEMDWETARLDLGRLRSRLQTADFPALWLRNVPNSRVEADALAVELLKHPEPGPAARLRDALRSHASKGHSPEEFWDLGAELGYSVEVTWTGQNPGGGYDVVLWQRGSSRPSLPRTRHPAGGDRRLSGRLANQPLMRSLTHSLVSELREHLSHRLPDYMVPQSMVLLETLPLTPGGKLDRHSLPAPASGEPLDEVCDKPGSPAEQTIADIWSSVLKVGRVGTRDNFFELGGHSLLATQAMSRIRQAFGIDLPLRTIFEAPTVTALAAAIANPPVNGNAAYTERLLRDLDAISEEEAERLLAADAGGEHP